MKRLIGDINNEEPIARIPFWKRFILMLVYILRLMLHDVLHVFSHLTEKEKRDKLFENVGGFLNLFYEKIKQEGILKESAALTYITLLGFLPFLVLVIFLAPKVPFLSSTNRIANNLYQQFLPSSALDAGWMVSQLVAKQVTLNLFSFILVIVTSYSLFKVIRDTFDRILVMEFQPPKDLLSQLLKFFGTIIFGFLIILMLFSSSSIPILSSLMKFPLFKKWLIYVAPFILQFVGLIFLYMIMPSIKVKRSSLIRGAFWTTLVWVILKTLFDYYIYHLTNIEAVFGVLKSLPIFLFWIYVNWVIILSGMVMVAIMEQKGKAIDAKCHKQHFVRMTLEMYTDKKLDKDIDELISKDTLQEIIYHLTKEKKE